MGLYDTVDVDGKHIQIKCWGERMHDVKIGDPVPAVCGFSTYAIACREGGYLNVLDGVLVCYTDVTTYEPVFDKYGDQFGRDRLDRNISTGQFGEPYLYADRTQEAESTVLDALTKEL